MKWDDRVALVTGASRGIGRAVALNLGGRGARVAVNYLKSEAAAAEVVSAIESRGGRAMAVPADVRNLDAVRGMAERVAKDLGPIDIWVNNAGIVRDNLAMFMKDEEWDDVLDTDLKGVFHCVKVAARDMVRRRRGRIVNIGSDAGVLGDMMRVNYAAAKAGLVGLTRALARELAASGVTVNTVSPGVVETDMIAGMTDAKRQKMMERIPMGRFGTADEVADVVAYLASDEAAYITGHVICVDGGLHTGG